MRTVQYLVIALNSLFFFHWPWPRAAAATESEMRVVMQVNSQNEMVIVRALRDAVEIAEDAQTEQIKLDLRIIVYGSSLDQFEVGGLPEVKAYFEKLSKHDTVHLFASEETLNRIHKTPKSLLPGFTLITSGPLTVLKLEREGYLYLKP